MSPAAKKPPPRKVARKRPKAGGASGRSVTKQAHHAVPRSLDVEGGEASKQVLMGLARRNPGVWFESKVEIVLDDGTKKKAVMNVLQQRILRAYKYCHDNDIPCRIIILKPRQRGSSTFTVNLGKHDLQSSPEGKRGLIIGGKYKQVGNLWKILSVASSNDTCDWQGPGMVVNNDRAYIPGKENCEILKETANDPDAGRSGTFQFVIVTELGRWMAQGVANASKVLSGLLSCVHRKPGTTVIIESTAQGASGEFYSRYQSAVSLEDFKEGRRGSGYIKVFAAWWEFPDLTIELTEKEERELEADLSDYEITERDRYGWTLGQLAWRRYTIAEEFDGDAELFKQEYPSNEEEAFLMSGRPRFDARGLAALRALAKSAKPDYGNIELDSDGNASWTTAATEGEAQFVRWEQPKEGMYYLLSVDTMTGEDRAMGEHADFHSVNVWRKGYIDADTGQWQPPKQVARIKPPSADYRSGCRWEISVLEEAVWNLAQYFGNCRMSIEMNAESGLVELLKKRGSAGGKRPVFYEQEVFNEREQRKTKRIGWYTTPKTRGALLTTLGQAIHEYNVEGSGVEIMCPHMVNECANMIYRDSGRVEAAPGWHDDDPIGAAIGLQTINHATVYRLPRLRRTLPPEVRRLQSRQENGVSGQYG